jgi:hypothetical protein
MRRTLLSLVLAFYFFSALAQHPIPAWISGDETLEVTNVPLTYTLAATDSAILFGGAFDSVDNLDTPYLAWFDGEEVNPFSPPLIETNAAVFNIVDVSPHIIVCGRLISFNGAARLINGQWEAFGIPNVSIIHNIHESSNGYYALSNNQIYYRAADTWETLPSELGMEFTDVEIFNDELYAVADSSLYLWNNNTWSNLGFSSHRYIEISEANNRFFAVARPINAINNSTFLFEYSNSGTNEDVLSWEIGSMKGEVRYAGGQYYLYEQGNQNLTLPTGFIFPIGDCNQDSYNGSITNEVEFNGLKYALMVTPNNSGMYIIPPTNQCRRIENDFIVAYVDAYPKAHSESPAVLGPSGVMYKKMDGTLASLYQSNDLWIHGVSENVDALMANPMHRTSRNSFFGPKCDQISTEFLLKYARSYIVTKAQIQEHIQSLSSSSYNIPDDILNWPAHGNVSNGESYYLAPFVDIDGDNEYHPELGDYPKILGDVSSFYIIHDDHNIRFPRYFDDEGILPNSLGLEFHIFQYLFLDGPEELQKTLFTQTKVINRSSENYTLKLASVTNYNTGRWNTAGLATKADLNATYAYSNDVSSPLYDFPLDFEDYGGAVAHVSLNLPLTSSININDNLGTVGRVPVIEEEYVHFMNGRWKDGEQLNYGEQGRYNPHNGDPVPTSFVYPSDPWDNSTDAWTNLSNFHTENYNMIAGQGSITLNAQESFCYNEAFVATQATVAQSEDPYNAVSKLFAAIPLVQEYYNSNMEACVPSITSNTEEFNISNNTISVYPNPATSNVMVRMSQNLSTESTINIYNSLGQIVDSKILPAYSSLLYLDVSQYQSGIYIIQHKEQNVKISVTNYK